MLVSVKNMPTYYARGRLGQQRFTLSCEVQSTGTPLKYRIRPTLTFFIGGGVSGTVTVNESLESYSYGSASEGTPVIGLKTTTPQAGIGTLTLNVSWQTRMRLGTNIIQPDGNVRCDWRTNTQIYIDMFKVATNGTISVESQQLVNETNVAYGQNLQTQTFTGINLGNGTCSWIIRKETQCTGSVSDAGNGASDVINTLRLNSYSYTTSAETISNPSGEVFYLAIGR